MRKNIKSLINANLQKNANKRAIHTKLSPYEVLRAKFKSAAELKAKENSKSPERSLAQRARRRRESEINTYLNQQTPLGDEPFLRPDDSEIKVDKIKLPYRLQLAFDEIEAENAFEESDFGRLMRARRDN